MIDIFDKGSYLIISIPIKKLSIRIDEEFSDIRMVSGDFISFSTKSNKIYRINELDLSIQVGFVSTNIYTRIGSVYVRIRYDRNGFVYRVSNNIIRVNKI